MYKRPSIPSSKLAHLASGKIGDGLLPLEHVVRIHTGEIGEMAI